MNTRKKLPCGQSNYEKIRTENYIYVDKTRFIEQIENEANSYVFLIRPRKFGKSLFLSTLKSVRKYIEFPFDIFKKILLLHLQLSDRSFFVF